MLSPLIFKLDGRALRVEKKGMYQKKFQDDTAYILSKYNPYVYPYRGKVDDYHDAIYPGIYIIDKKPFLVRPITDIEKDTYSIKNIITLTPESIFKNLDKSECIDLDITESTFGDDEIFKPEIKSSDDIALAGLKYAIAKKNINFNAYANKFQDSATKNNGKRAITHGSSLKMDMLNRFSTIFDIGVGLVFFDKNGCQNPMDKDNKEAYVIFDSDYTDLSKRDFVVIESNVNRGDDE